MQWLEYAGLNCDERNREHGAYSSKARISRTRPGAGWAALPLIIKATLRSALAPPAAQLIRKFVTLAVWWRTHWIPCLGSNIFSTEPAVRVPRPIAGAITAISLSILWTIARFTTQTSTIRLRPASTGAPLLATSDSPDVQHRKRARVILLLLLVAGARRFLMPRYQSMAVLMVQLYPMARTTRCWRPARIAI